MYAFLIIAGTLAAIIGLGSGLTMNPQSAPQQAVQRLDIVIGLLGIAVIGIGYIVAHIRSIANSLRAPNAMAQVRNDKGPAVASEA